MVQHQGGSVELHTCRGSESLPERNIGDVIQPALSNQKTWWCLGCQWLQQCGLLQELKVYVKQSVFLQFNEGLFIQIKEKYWTRIVACLSVSNFLF